VVPTGTTAMFSEYATAVVGIVQEVLVGMGMVRISLAANAGPPNGKLPYRVSTTRHGDMATKNAGTPRVAAAFLPMASSRMPPLGSGAALAGGCQYRGAGQLEI